MGNQLKTENTFSDIESLSYDDCFAQVDHPLLAQRMASIEADSPFYQQKYAKVGISTARSFDMEQFAALPFTTKQEILAEQESYPPFGRLALNNKSCQQRVHITSGSTGKPFVIMMTRDDVTYTIEAGARAFRCAGLESSDVVVHCLNYCMWAGGVTDHLSLEAAGAAVIPFGVGNSHKLIETILAIRPTAISCTPSYLSRLELLLHQDFKLAPADLGLKKAFLGGEGGLQNATVRKRIEDTWQIKAIDANYGMSEVLSIIGAECSFRQALHFHGQGLVYLELIDPADGKSLPVVDGEEGEMVLTTLRREAQPLIRYRTGDIVKVVATDECQCGRKSPRFLVTGRVDDMITVCGINVFPAAVAKLLAEHPNLFSGEFEFVLESPPPYERPLLNVELAQGVDIAGNEEIERFVISQCHQRLNFTPAMQLLSFGKFLRTDGKTKRIRKTY